MWILESSGDFLQGKRMWLKPGKKYLFGRVRKDGVRFAIDHKTVSRKHFIIEVDQVKDGDAGNVHARTRITVTDQNSKAGTFVDGEPLKTKSKDLMSSQHSVRPGSVPHELIIKWEPCVISFQITKKELKAGVLQTKQNRLKNLDIKAVGEFLTGQTTHFVVNKRNTAKGLQTLVNAKHLVAESYLDALEYAATPTTLDEDEDLSPLERDFDSAWPDPMSHLPPRGQEPTTKPDEAYAPDLRRQNMFEKFTFVFLDPNQHKTLLPPITDGHGKALLFNLDDENTTVDDLLKYMQNAAGRKGFGTVEENASTGGVLLVRWNRADDFETKTTILINEVSVKLDQRAIEQSEFLDAILAVNAMQLRQSVPFESTDDGLKAPPPSAGSATITTLSPRVERNNAHRNGHTKEFEPVQSSSTLLPESREPSEQPEEQPSRKRPPEQNSAPTAPPPKRPRFRAPTQNTAFTFDDDFDPNSVVPYESDDESAAAGSQFQSQDEDQNHLAPKREPRSATRKRTRSPSPAASEGDAPPDALDELFPAAAAMKKRKLAAEADARRKGIPLETLASISNITKPAPKPKKPKKEIDVREEARAQREKKDLAAQRDRERLEDLPPLDMEDKRPTNLAVVVQMDIPVREKNPSTTVNGGPNDRWDPKWNGRKNFKKFRRQGEGSAVRRGTTTQVMVPLVEVKRNTFGLGHEYLEKSVEEREKEKRRKAAQRANLDRSLRYEEIQRDQYIDKDDSENDSNDNDNNASDSEVERRRSHPASNTIPSDRATPVPIATTSTDPANERTSIEITQLQREAASIVDEPIDVDAPRQTRHSQALRDSESPKASRTRSITTNHTMATPAAGNAGGRKQAPTSTRSNAPSAAASTSTSMSMSTAKGKGKQREKQTTITIRDSDSGSEDSDDMKFRFKKRAGRNRAGGRGAG